MTGRHRPTRMLSRILVRLMPRDLRREYGRDMVQLAMDRATHTGEPAWRLWPSLVSDTAVVVARTRSEHTMIPVRPLAVGAVFAVSVFAALSGDVLVALGIAALGIAVAVALLARRDPAPAHARAWLTWVILGVVLCAGSLATVAIAGDHEFAAPAWLAVMGTLLIGLTSLATGVALAVQRAPRAGVAVAPE